MTKNKPTGMNPNDADSEPKEDEFAHNQDRKQERLASKADNPEPGKKESKQQQSPASGTNAGKGS